MSILVSHLSKNYGTQRAVDDISFEIKPGEIVGFLGPNGAGKSTTMKILTCFIPATAGSASVSGFDVKEKSLQVRKRIGYLPENNPLYSDLYVEEFLRFAAGLHGMKKPKMRIEEMISLTGLTKERKKKIGALSKGYRQRVGLAQAMLHDPEVLIMDEPTSGLDPNQLTEIRKLIHDLGENKTVILSTHIMQEVIAICSRALIISKGKLVADDSIQNLQKQSGNSQTALVVEFKQTVPVDKLRKISGVKKAEMISSTKFRLTGSSELDETVFRFAVESELTILSLSREQQSLEEIFRQLTSNPAEK